ncbi:MAG: UDP-3-O-acyl-N-acetylglucosamine deacetylase [Pseudomonadota bacterium]
MSDGAYQHTIANTAMCAGVGVHSGERAKLVLKPAPENSGIRFVRTDVAGQGRTVTAIGTSVSDVTLCTTLTNDAGVSVSVVEHLLAACAGMGIDNLTVEIDGVEVPIMDGSSLVFCELIRSAGLKAQRARRRRIRILSDVMVEEGPRWARLSPSDRDDLTFQARIDYDNPAIGVQQMSMRLTPGQFMDDVAFARTFGFARDVEKLKAMGLARGGSLDNAVVIDGDAVVNPEGLRADDEFVRHKLLDAIGDLMLAGAPIAGAYSANQPGHGINNQLVRKLLATPQAWSWETAGASVEDAAPLQAFA